MAIQKFAAENRYLVLGYLLHGTNIKDLEKEMVLQKDEKTREAIKLVIEITHLEVKLNEILMAANNSCA